MPRSRETGKHLTGVLSRVTSARRGVTEHDTAVLPVLLLCCCRVAFGSILKPLFRSLQRQKTLCSRPMHTARDVASCSNNTKTNNQNLFSDGIAAYVAARVPHANLLMPSMTPFCLCEFDSKV